MSDETKGKIRRSNKGKVKSPEWRRHISEAKMGTTSPKKGKPQPSSSYKRSEETRRRMSVSRKLMLQSHPEIKEILDRNMLGGRLGGHMTEQTKARLSESKKRLHREHPEIAKAHSECMKGKRLISLTHGESVKKLWQDPNYVKRIMDSRNLKPNKAEVELGKILQGLYPDQFKYNGDFRLGIVLNRCIPDFVNVNGKKQVIELFGGYWHTQEGRGEEAKLAKYKEVGWDCLVVWDKELSETDALKNKIRAFVGDVISQNL